MSDATIRELTRGALQRATYFDRAGQPIDMDDWLKKVQDIDYKRVEETWVGPWRVSTVWLGIDHSYHGHARLLFETMVFDELGQTIYSDDLFDRYTTEEQARAGHARAVEAAKRLQAGSQPPKQPD